MTEAKKAVARKDISKEYQWQVEKLYTDEALWEADLNTARDLLGKAKDFQGHLADSVLIFLDFLSYQEDLSRLLDKAYLYAAMKKDEDNSVAHYQDMKDRVMGLVVEAESVLSFFQPEVLAMPQYRLGEYLQNPKIDIYRKFLLDITRQRPHTLSMEEERILSMTGEMAASFQTIYGMLCNVDMEFPMIINDAGQEEQLTHGNYIRLMESPQREVRKNAYNALYAAYGKENNTIASIYNSSVKKDAFYARVHKYDSALAASLFADNVPIAVYDKLIGCVRNHLPLLWEYLDLRKELLNLDQLAMYDVYVPLFNKGERQYNYQEAKETILKGLAPLGDEYLQKVAQGLDSGWVDVYENIGKTPGAYSTGIYGSDPYILMNFQGNLNSVFTLAHEMGHSMHTYYSNTKQPYIYTGYRIFVAEVASTV
ncbi:MAG: M3 family oligoendopeptidase, partial [Clostridiales bacterium]